MNRNNANEIPSQPPLESSEPVQETLEERMARIKAQEAKRMEEFMAPVPEPDFGPDPFEKGESGESEPAAAESVESEKIFRVEGKDYRFEEELGAGAMGTVYLAREVKTFKGKDKKFKKELLGDKVAIKVLNENIFKNPKARERFLRELQVQAAVSNVQPHIVSILGVEKLQDTKNGDETMGIVMEYMEGGSLEEKVDELYEDPDFPNNMKPYIATVADQICQGLQAMHDMGLVHRDVKAANVLLDVEARVAKLTDLGLARASKEEEGVRYTPKFSQTAKEKGPELYGKERIGQQIDKRIGLAGGSPSAMSPELIKGNPATPMDDVYALGALFYEMRTGHEIYRLDPDKDGMEVALQDRRIKPIPSIEERLGEEFVPSFNDALIEAMLDLDPEKRKRVVVSIKEDSLTSVKKEYSLASAKDVRATFNELARLNGVRNDFLGAVADTKIPEQARKDLPPVVEKVDVSGLVGKMGKKVLAKMRSSENFPSVMVVGFPPRLLWASQPFEWVWQN